jgi:hypothetical protein
MIRWKSWRDDQQVDVHRKLITGGTQSDVDTKNVEEVGPLALPLTFAGIQRDDSGAKFDENVGTSKACEADPSHHYPQPRPFRVAAEGVDDHRHPVRTHSA